MDAVGEIQGDIGGPWFICNVHSATLCQFAILHIMIYKMYNISYISRERSEQHKVMVTSSPTERYELKVDNGAKAIIT